MKKIIIKITIENNRFMLLESIPKNLDKIDKHFTYNDNSACYVRGSFRRDNIVKVHFLIRKKDILTAALLPIGFKKDLEDFLIDKKAIYKFIDNRKYENFNFSDDEIRKNLHYLTLYDFQVEAVKKCLSEHNGVIKSPTGSGKTELILSLCNLMKKKTLILFARIDLAHQTLNRAKKARIDAGIVQGNNIDEDHLVVMATVQSIHKVKNKYDMIIVDETHRASADNYYNILAGSNFKYRFGFSATPWTKNKFKNAKTKAFIGHEIYSVSPTLLINDEKIAKPIIHLYPINRPKNLDRYKFIGAERHGIIRNDFRNKVIANLVKSFKGQTLILIKKIEQGEKLSSLINNSYFLYGESDRKERKDVVNRFDNGEEFVLIASTIFDEGISIDNVNNVVIAGGGASFIKALQRVGRGTRITKNKKTVNIYDFIDLINPILLRHSNQRIKIYKQYGYTDIIFHNESEIIKIFLENKR